MFAITHSGALFGIESVPVEIEINTGERGDLRFILVGLPDTAVKESLDRVCSALQNSGFKLPHSRTTINLSPGHLRKEGPIYDLPIALGLLAATGQLRSELLNRFLIAGELSLSGKILPVRGAVSLAIQAKKQKFHGVILPEKSAQEATLIQEVEIYCAKDLREIVAFLQSGEGLLPLKNEEKKKAEPAAWALNFSDVQGQGRAKRVAEIAVAGGHNLILIGSPGVGKSMIAKRLPSIMSSPTREEYIEILGIHSAAGNFLGDWGHNFERPFRAPHHTISRVGLIGGGVIPRPGEISLSHRGILFLDEIAEFPRQTLEVLRQPLDDGKISISRNGGKVTFPCEFILVAAMNPCPCGYMGSPTHQCCCSVKRVQDYRSKISGPLLDRIDLQINVPEISAEALANNSTNETSEQIRGRVEKAQLIQAKRFQGMPIYANGKIPDNRLRSFCRLGEAQIQLLQRALTAHALSARTCNKILKISRTIADLEGSENIDSAHLIEALQYRILDTF